MSLALVGFKGSTRQIAAGNLPHNSFSAAGWIVVIMQLLGNEPMSLFADPVHTGKEISCQKESILVNPFQPFTKQS